MAEMSHLYLPLRVGSDTALSSYGTRHRTGRLNWTRTSSKGARPDLTSSLNTSVSGHRNGRKRLQVSLQKTLKPLRCGTGVLIRVPSTIHSEITEHICGVENVQSLCNIALMTGNVGREGTGINPMRGQNNIQGAGDSAHCRTTIPVSNLSRIRSIKRNSKRNTAEKSI